MNEEDFRQFVTERPALNLSALATELKIDRVTLHKILSGIRGIPKTKRGTFLAIAKKYGFTEIPDDDTW